MAPKSITELPKQGELIPGEYSERVIKDGPGELDLACALFRGRKVEFKVQTEGRIRVEIHEASREESLVDFLPNEFILQGAVRWEDEKIAQGVEIAFNTKTRQGKISFLAKTWNL